MKKRCLLLSSLFSVSVLASCGGSVSETIVKAIESLKGDFKVETTIINSRNYLNPWYSENNTSKEFFVNQEFAFSADKTGLHVKTDLSMKDGELESAVQSETGYYDLASGLMMDEFLNYKNERELRLSMDVSSADTIHVSSTNFYNFFSELKAEDFKLSEDGSKATYSGNLGSTLANYYIGFNSEVTSAEFGIENDRFTSFSFTFNDCEGQYISTNFDSAKFTESCSISGSFSYDDLTLKDLEPVSTNKVSALDDALSAFKDKSFTIQSINPEYVGEEDACMSQVIFDGDKIVADFVDIMTFGLGNLSWLDGILVKDETNGKYFVNNLAMNEDTGEHYWASTKEVVESAGITPNDSAIYYEEGRFDLDFLNIDSSLFTLRADTTDTYDLDPKAAKYFGECIVPVFMDYTSILTSGMVASLEAYTSLGESWYARILEDGSILFATYAKADFGGAASASEWGFVLCNPGTSDVSPFYTDQVPPPFGS